MYKKLNYIFNRQDRIKIVLLMIMMIIGSFLELLGVAVFQPFVDLLMDASKVQEEGWMNRLYQLFDCGSLTQFLSIHLRHTAKTVHEIVDYLSGGTLYFPS